MTSPLPAESRSPQLPFTEPDAAAWHRLHPLTPLVRAGSRLVALVVVLLAISLANQKQDDGQLIADLVVIGIALSGGFVSWLVTRWQVADGVLRIDTGLIRRDSRRFPLSQIQAIDVVQTGLARVLGLAELQLRVAGADSSRGGRLACLRLADAEQLRRELLAMSASASAAGISQEKPVPLVTEAETDGGAAPQPDAWGLAPAAAGELPAGQARVAPYGARPLFRVRSGRLAVAIALSKAGAIAAAVIIAVVTVVAVTGETAVVASFLPVALGLVLVVWRQFNGEYATTVAAAPDGLRLRSGLIQTTAETIRPGRVQGIRLVEPLIWRAFGWCRLEVDVAGPKERRESRSEGQRLRPVIPVGSRAEAVQMIDELLASRPLPGRRAPGAARLKAPLLYHFLGWGRDERYVVTSRGRICRVTTWVPLEKVQSIRWVQGPLQRRLGLASVLLDVAGKRVHADIEDRTEGEADALLRQLPDLAAAARALAR